MRHNEAYLSIQYILYSIICFNFDIKRVSKSISKNGQFLPIFRLKKIECGNTAYDVTWELILFIFTVTDRYRLIPKDAYSKLVCITFLKNKVFKFHLFETLYFNCMRSKCIFCNFRLISSDFCLVFVSLVFPSSNSYYFKLKMPV